MWDRLLELDLGASFFQFLLGGFSICFGGRFLDSFGCAIDQVFGFFEAKISQTANNLDDLDFLSAGALQYNVKLGLFFNSSSITATSDAQLRALSDAFRQLPCPVVGRINDKKLLLDLRCLDGESQFVEQSGKLKELLAC